MRVISVRPQYTFAHARITGKINDGDALQAKRPRRQQMESAVPGEIVNASGCLEENNRRARRMRRVTSYKLRHARDLEIIEPADESAFETLGEKFFHPILTNHSQPHIPAVPTNPPRHP